MDARTNSRLDIMYGATVLKPEWAVTWEPISSNAWPIAGWREHLLDATLTTLIRLIPVLTALITFMAALSYG